MTLKQGLFFAFVAIVSVRAGIVSKTLPLPQKAPYAECSNIGNDGRFDCYPEGIGATQQSCEARGCCWVPAGDNSLEPWCFYPNNFGGYNYVNLTNTETGQIAFLERTFQSPYPGDVRTVRMDVEYQTDTTVRIKLSDPNNKRWETTYPRITRQVKKAATNPQYQVNIDQSKTGFQVARKDGAVIFNSQNVGGLVFADQFLQITTLFSGTIYGLGEHRTTLALDQKWSKFTLFNHDAAPSENLNLYGSHPFYLVMEPSGKSYGVYLHNSNAMDVVVQPLPALTFRTIGGILDLYVFLGPTPGDVIRQFTDLVGRSEIPPYWSLGFQLCRYGYGSSAATRAAWQRTIDAGIPFDVQWNDIDYMITQNDFTVDPNRYGDLPQLVSDIHSAGMHYVPILDPGISAAEPAGSYPPFDDGVAMDVLTKDRDGNVFVGQTWNPVSTAYPDFTHPRAVEYWQKQFEMLYQKVKFDGMWIDMNEPSNFLDGTVNGCPQDSLENPPFTPAVAGGKLSYHTVCMNAKHAIGTHYDTHNIYGIAEADVTHAVLKNMGKRPFVISRSSFTGIQKYAGHWGGDNLSGWYDLTKSVPELLTFSIFGVPFMGSDICGFRDNSWENLCNRWMQLGAFYPFSRNHNTIGTRDQDPAIMGDMVINSSKKALYVRYTLLPYLYTLMYNSHVYGDTVSRPLFFEFPSDSNTYQVDRSFLWGSGLYIVPVTEEYSTSVQTYLPAGRWYDWYSGAARDSNGGQVTLDAPLDTIPLLVRGGVVLPTQAPATTTTISRKNGFTFIAALDSNGAANGTLYWDDGDSIDPVENNAYGLLNLNLAGKTFKTEVVQWNTQDTPNAEGVKILGATAPNQVSVNGQSAQFSFDDYNKVLSITGFKIPLNTAIQVTWS